MVIRVLEPELYTQFSALRDRSIGDIMQEPIVASPDSTISQIIGLMDKHDAYTVFIDFNGRIASINMRDILEYRDIDHARPSMVGKIVPPLSRGHRIGYAARMMGEYRLRALPVVEDNRIVGQVTSDAIVRMVNAYGIDNVRAGDIMTPDPVVVNVDNKVASARGMMIRHKIDHLPVINDGRVAGILTSRHLLMTLKPPDSSKGRADIISNKTRMLDLKVSGILDKHVVVSEPHESVKSVVSKMIDGRVAYTLVTVGEELQGIITHRDVVGLLQEMVREEVPLYIVGLPEDPFDAELAKSKFANLVRLIRKVVHDLSEARCNIKIRDMGGERRRYEVKVNIVSLSDTMSYTADGYDLAMIFDQISDSFKKRIAHRDSKGDTRGKGKGKGRRRRGSESIRYKVDFYTLP
ncbi:MAG: CBS domain-containing protein [Candidatus Nitrosocaldus sp.]|nr:CBS domain-containing protein [Candidatus Nitrosocaldus sp.]MDW8276275.1 CBS domain-containing protein [Candidatus Nitrosocaldus sp.]